MNCINRLLNGWARPGPGAAAPPASPPKTFSISAAINLHVTDCCHQLNFYVQVGPAWKMWRSRSPLFEKYEEFRTIFSTFQCWRKLQKNSLDPFRSFPGGGLFRLFQIAKFSSRKVHWRVLVRYGLARVGPFSRIVNAVSTQLSSVHRTWLLVPSKSHHRI